MKLKGFPLTLDTYEPADVLTNKHFARFVMPDFEKVYLPSSMRPFMDNEPEGSR